MKKQLAVSVVKNVVTVEIICSDAYEARVVADDITERMKAGDGFSLNVKGPPQTGIIETVAR